MTATRRKNRFYPPSLNTPKLQNYFRLTSATTVDQQQIDERITRAARLPDLRGD
jgi:hypothetical protein